MLEVTFSGLHIRVRSEVAEETVESSKRLGGTVPRGVTS